MRLNLQTLKKGFVGAIKGLGIGSVGGCGIGCATGCVLGAIAGGALGLVLAGPYGAYAIGELGLKYGAALGMALGTVGLGTVATIRGAERGYIFTKPKTNELNKSVSKGILKTKELSKSKDKVNELQLLNLEDDLSKKDNKILDTKQQTVAKINIRPNTKLKLQSASQYQSLKNTPEKTKDNTRSNI